MPEQMTDYVLGFKEDKASTQKAIKGIQRVEKAMDTLDSSQDAVSSTAKRVNAEIAKIRKRRNDLKRIADAYKSTSLSATDLGIATVKAARLLQRMGATESEVRGVVRQLGQGTTEAEALALALDKAERNAHELADVRFRDVSSRAALAGDVESTVRTIGGAFGSFGGSGTERAAAQAGELFAVIEAAPRLKAAFQGMPQVLKAAGQEIGGVGFGLIGATIALTAAYALAQKAQKRLEESIKATLSTEIELAGFLATATDQEKQDRLENARITLKTLEAEKQVAVERQENVEQIRRILQLGGAAAPSLGTDILTSGTVSGFLELSSEIPIIGELTGETAEYLTTARLAKDELEDVNTELRATNTEIGILEGELGDTVIATQEQIDAERELAKARELSSAKTIIQINKEIVEAQLDANRLLEAGNKKALDDKVASLQQELSDTQAIYDQLSLVRMNASGVEKDLLDEELDALAIQQTQLGRLIEIYGFTSDEISKNAVAMRRFAESITEAKQSTATMRDLFNTVKDGAQEAIDAQQEMAKLSEQSAGKILDIRRSLSEKEAGLLRDLNRSLTDARAKANQALQDLDRKHSQDLLDAERDYQREQAKIIADAQRDMNNAIASRDVLGFREARTARDDELTAAREAYDEQRQELQLNYERQLNEIQIGLTRQQEELRRRYQQQLSDARQAANLQIQQEQQRIQAELSLRQQGYQQMLSLEQSFIQQQISAMQMLVQSGAGILNSLVGQVSQAQNIAQAGINQALSNLGQTSTSPNVVLPGGSGGTFNQTNNFPTGTNSQQLIQMINSQIAGFFDF